MWKITNLENKKEINFIRYRDRNLNPVFPDNEIGLQVCYERTEQLVILVYKDSTLKVRKNGLVSILGVLFVYVSGEVKRFMVTQNRSYTY